MHSRFINLSFNRLQDPVKQHIFYHAAFSSFFYSSFCIFLFTGTERLYCIGKYKFLIFLGIIFLAELICCNLKKSPSFLLPSTGKKSDQGLKWWRIIFTITLTTGLYFTVAILLGAEVFTKHEETLMFSLLLSLLTAWPLCLNLGCSSFTQIFFGLKAISKYETYWSQVLFTTLGGAWLGAIAIPLDWDRPWQQWPISCSSGALLGHLTSNLLTVYRLLRN